jgi:hypothetical protein
LAKGSQAVVYTTAAPHAVAAIKEPLTGVGAEDTKGTNAEAVPVASNREVGANTKGSLATINRTPVKETISTTVEIPTNIAGSKHTNLRLGNLKIEHTGRPDMEHRAGRIDRQSREVRFSKAIEAGEYPRPIRPAIGASVYPTTSD